MPRKIARTEDFRQLEFLFTDHVQWSYELIRPIALFEDITIKGRSQETGRHPKTISKHLRRFRRKGMLGLFPEWETISHLPRKKRVPEEIKKEILKLKGLYQGLHNYELARIIFIKFGYPISHSTVKKIIEENRYRIQPELQFTLYHDSSDAYQARLKVVKLYYCGWSKNSIALFLGLSRPHVYRLIRMFEGEQFQGLTPQSTAPKHPRQKLTLPLMVKIYHLQRKYPRAGEFRIWTLLDKEGIQISQRTVGRAMAFNRIVYDDLRRPAKEKKPSKPHPYKAQFRHQYWFIDVRHLDTRIDGKKVYSICILEGYSRTILAGVVSFSEALWAVLIAFYSACRKYGLPVHVVTDRGSAFRSGHFKEICRRLGIDHIYIKRRKSFENLIESFFTIQYRMGDYQFSGAKDFLDLQHRHCEFLETYNTTKHWGLMEGEYEPAIPLDLLGQIKGRAISQQELDRNFHEYVFPRKVNPYGYVSLHSYYFYAEEGLAKKQDMLWRSVHGAAIWIFMTFSGHLGPLPLKGEEV